MGLRRYSSRRQRLYDAFLSASLKGARSYDRIAGYFQSSLLDLAAVELRAVPRVRIVCNSDVSPADVQTVRRAVGKRREELRNALLRMMWNRGDFPHLVDVYGESAQTRLSILEDLIARSGKEGRVFEIRIVPDCEFGFVHGKAGVIRYEDEQATSFIGSANDSASAWSRNYELVWESDDPGSVQWVQEEFDALWERGFALNEFIVKQIGRLGRRSVIEHVGTWQQSPDVGPVLAEVPTCTELFGFWDHQKYFIKKAFDEHRLYAGDSRKGARYLLADGVGLGKTLQLGAIAKLIGTLEDAPILIVAPKALVAQWQDEMLDKLAAPSAVWTGRGWLTERDEFHPATEDDVLNCPRKIAIVSTSAVISAPRSVHNTRLTDALLSQRFSCVLWDEAHKIRRANLREPRVWNAPDKNLLYQWAEKLAARAQTMILATATPVQLHPIELWDLLYVLGINNPQVLGSELSRWRDVSDSRVFDLLAGRTTIEDAYAKWEFWKDPVPREENPETEVFRHVRATIGLADAEHTASNADFDRLDPLDRDDMERLSIREVNPFTSRVVKRSRERLERDGKLIRIELVPVEDDRPVVTSHSLQQAIELSESFSRELHKRVKASGFIKTLLQRRVGSSVAAGRKTTGRMLAERDVEDEEGLNEAGEGIYPLTDAERELLSRLETHLERQQDQEGDPKFDRVLQTLRSGFDGNTWLERGVLIFTQYYDSAYALCEFLAEHVEDAIGLYANTSASKLFEAGKVQSINRELLKEKVSSGVLRLLVGTDAASTGLNLQRLGCLINLDLPWNPVVLEQRKGRVQRGTVAKRIPFCNLRYDRGVEQRLFNVLTGRIQEITAIFGTIPDFITDQWVDSLLEDRELSESDLVKIVSDREASPFEMKECYEYLADEWEATEDILNEREAIARFLDGW